MAALMSRVLVTVLLLCAAAAAQSAPTPPTTGGVAERKEIFKNNRVRASFVSLGPGEFTTMHKHDRDWVTVFLSGDRIQQSLPTRELSKTKIETGEVRFRKAGLIHATRNVGTAPFKAVIVEFNDPQGESKDINKKSQTCAPGSKACVEEKELFCTDKVCVEDVEMAPGSVTLRHSHATDHMLVAVSDYELTDEVEGKGTIVRRHKSGEVEYIPAGITHRLTNTGGAPARFTVIIWK
jgi:quercetin dioxygenase-like cupin family protein